MSRILIGGTFQTYFLPFPEFSGAFITTDGEPTAFVTQFPAETPSAPLFFHPYPAPYGRRPDRGS